MANSLDITVEQAREIVQKEAGSKGWVRPGLSQSQNPETIELLTTLRHTRESLGEIIDIIATGIGSRRSRFILELIQNVEDCDFNNTSEPTLRLELNQKEIIIESNQDGFIERDVSGLCRIGGSWKRGMPGYVGDKGIGFKSVFGFASKVDVQSNAFSFYFVYNGGETTDDKLGIITPIVGDNPIALDQRPLTRMTLTLDGKTSHDSLVSAFTAIPSALLLFLYKLKKINFDIFSMDHERTISTAISISNEGEQITCITEKNELWSGPKQIRYIVVRAPLRGLPDDPARVDNNECEGVLAFPVDAQGLPDTRPPKDHDIYAFLPVCTVGFNFLLQADFLVHANREAVIVESDWNIEILKQISDVFCHTMERFSTTPNLSYSWMRFLPIRVLSHENPLWTQLSSQVMASLSQARIFYAHTSTGESEEDLRSLPSQLRILPESHLDDRSRSPLFLDLPRTGDNKRYLSLSYEQFDVELLRKAFDMLDIGDVQMVRRINQDLRSSCSKMKDPKTDAYWHTRAANLISKLISRDSNVANMIKMSLPLIPLSDGRWVTTSASVLKFPAQRGPSIPQDLVVTVDYAASSNPSRKAMFEKLGVTEITPAEVIEKLWRLYKPRLSALELKDSKAHLAYLYWHYDQLQSQDARFSQLTVYDDEGKQVLCNDVRAIYMPCNNEYGPRELLKSVQDPLDHARLVRECLVCYLNDEYLDAFDPQTRRNGLTWIEWLQRGPGVRCTLRLKNHGGSLSPEFRHLLRYRPDRILKVLESNWKVYRNEMTDSIQKEISEAAILCSNSHSAELKTTYFPLPLLTQKATELGVAEVFPFIKISDTTKAQLHQRSEDWRFLDRFGVRFEASLGFYLKIMSQHVGENRPVWSSETREGVIKAYEAITDNYNENTKNMVIHAFNRDGLILHPQSLKPKITSPVWLMPQNCLWRAPENLLDKISLASAPLYRNNAKIRTLFEDLLGIKNSRWTDYRDALLQLKQAIPPQENMEDRVKRLFKLLSSTKKSAEDLASFLNTLETDRLIYVPQDPFWFAPSQCLWASPVPVPGKALLEPFYTESLAAFFQDQVNVSAASLGTLVQGLKTLAQGQPSVDAIKAMIQAIAAESPTRQDLISLSTVNFLPISYTNPMHVKFQNCQSNFSIIDRVKLADIFRPHAGYLDYSLEEVQQLEPFLQALNLNNKYLSRLCSENTACTDPGLFDQSLTTKFRRRAHFLLRCLVSYRSPLTVPGHCQSLHDRLLNTSIYRSGSISTEYTITYQNNLTIGPIRQDMGYVHIQGSEAGWKVFVPKNRDDMEICYTRELPRSLALLFQVTELVAESIGHVLNSRFTIINELMERDGIGNVPGFETIQTNEGDSNVEDNSDNEDEEIAQPNLEESNQTATASQQFLPFPQRLYSPSSSILETESSGRSPSRVRSPPRSISPDQNGFTPNAYRDLLDNVIRIARQGSLPHHDAEIPGAGFFHPDYVHNNAFGVRTQGQMNHDIKIGAAGELFVYEHLQKLFSPSFNWGNWTSTINNQVLIHPEYHGRAPWPERRETSDIRYADHEGLLTQYLISSGYLDGNVWSGGRPEYFIEVKTTTGDCSDRFFISRNQYRMMQEMRLSEGQTSNKIYVIFRVFNLGKESLNVKIYVDPESHRRSGSLAFMEHTWTVTPTLH